MNWQELIRDKRFLAAAAAAAAVGVFVLVRKKGGAAAGDAEQTEAETAAGGKAFNTSGTDMASWISQYTTSVLDALRNMQTPAPNTPPPSTTTPPRTNVPRVPSEPPPLRLIPRDTRLPLEPVTNRVPVSRLGG